MKTVYNFYSDSGHAWLKVTRKEIESLGLFDKISHYSYQRNDNVYLEEDCDLIKFMQAKTDRKEVIIFREFHSKRTSKIRSYDSYF